MNSVMQVPSTERNPNAVHEHPALGWFNSLRKGNPGAPARLRRCRSRADVLMEPAAFQLAQRLGLLKASYSWDDARLGAALDLARVLAFVKVNDASRRLMRAAGWKTFPGDRKESDAGSDRPLLSQVRFRRLLTTEPGEPLVAACIRLVRQLDNTVNVADLSNDFLGWSNPERQVRVRNKWAYDYYAAGVAMPSSIAISINDLSTESEDGL